MSTCFDQKAQEPSWQANRLWQTAQARKRRPCFRSCARIWLRMPGGQKILLFCQPSVCIKLSHLTIIRSSESMRSKYLIFHLKIH